MECMLLPENPTRPLQKVPYVGTSRWDGGPFLTYPLRHNKPEMLPDPKNPEHLPWEIYNYQQPAEIKELESFFQTWLLFGVIAEALNANEWDPSVEDGEDTTAKLAKPKPLDKSVGEGEQGGESQSPDRVPDNSMNVSVLTSDNVLPPSAEGHESDAKSPNPSHADSSLKVLPHKVPTNVIGRIYDTFIVIEDGVEYISTSSLLKELEDSWSISLFYFKSTRDALEVRCKRMRKCLRRAHYFYTHLPKEFDSTIKLSIGVVGEIIGRSMTAACFYLNLKEYSPVDWHYGDFMTDERKAHMAQYGWCPSDLSRAINKFKSLQALHFISMLDKRQPERSHTGCNDENCQAYQIDVEKYKMLHVEEGCDCQGVAIDNSEVVAALKNGDSIPLLRFVGDLKNLRIEVVKSAKNTPYVSMSHVWADGLGNPHDNELQACQLIKLRTLVEALPPLTPQPVKTGDSPLPKAPKEIPLIWLDTLCCPVSPMPHKILSLTKMRQTYEQSHSVLVLDASLQRCSSSGMSNTELLARIFTSSWLRRLWTLQEGALAKHLYFQFSDRAVSLTDLTRELDSELRDMRNHVFALDIRHEIDRIQKFFQTSDGDSAQNLKILDDALRHRGVSVPTDEPLCIGTLMNLPEKPILAVAKEDRMKIVWTLLTQKYKTIPAEVIFFEEPKLPHPGFGWAPASFMTIQKSIFQSVDRSTRWECEAQGFPTPKGLKVTYPGFRLRVKEINDGKPRHPWKGLKRVPEDRIIFRDEETADWYSVGTKAAALRAKDYTEEENAVYQKLELFPLHDLMHGIQKEEGKDVFLLLKGYEKEKEHLERSATDGIIMTGKFDDSTSWAPCLGRKPAARKPVEGDIQHQVVVGPLNAIEAVFYNTVEQLALKLRDDPITDELLRIEDQEGEVYKECLERVKGKMKDTMRVALEENALLGMAVQRMWGEGIGEYLWPSIGDYWNHGFWGKRLDGGQVWFVD